MKKLLVLFIMSACSTVVPKPEAVNLPAQNADRFFVKEPNVPIKKHLIRAASQSCGEQFQFERYKGTVARGGSEEVLILFKMIDKNPEAIISRRYWDQGNGSMTSYPVQLRFPLEESQGKQLWYILPQDVARDDPTFGRWLREYGPFPKNCGTFGKK